MFAGELTVADVCARCNNEGLSRLDNYASEWWDRNVSPSATELHADEPTLGRWLAKVTYNMQRVSRREGNLGAEPPMPDEVARWIMNGTGRVHDFFGICVGRLPDGHDSTLNGGHDGPQPGMPMPLRFTHLQSLVFMTVWKAPNVLVSVDGMTKMICDSMPAVRLDLADGRGPRRLPVITSPDFVEKGLYGNLPLLNAISEHWRREDSRSR